MVTSGFEAEIIVGLGNETGNDIDNDIGEDMHKDNLYICCCLLDGSVFRKLSTQKNSR